MSVLYPARFRALCAVFTIFYLLTAFEVYSGELKYRDLVILNWSEYLDPELIDKFEHVHQANVKEVYYESDDLRDDMLLENNTSGYDLVIVNGISIEPYRKAGWLEPVDSELVPNLGFIDRRWIDAFEGVDGYAVPYFWGTVGIAYRKDLVNKTPTSWMDIFRPEENLRGRISMMKSSRDLIGMGMKALGYSNNSTDYAQLKQVEQMLLEQKPYVHTYDYLSLTEDSALVKGDVAMAMFYSGDALVVQEYNDQIDYIVPEEGGQLWVDYLVIMKSSTNKELAHAFINFINQPDNAAQLAEYVYYASPNSAAEKLLPEEFLNDPVIYPAETVINKSEFNRPIKARSLKQRDAVTTKIIQN